MFRNIITKLKSLLDGVSELQVVYPYERDDPDGTPFATITPAANENAYSTTSENTRVYAFTIRLFVERKGQTNVETCETTMRDLVDVVLDVLDSNHRLSGISLPAGYTFLFLDAAPSQWGYAGTRENEYRVADINVRVHISVDVNLI